MEKVVGVCLECHLVINCLHECYLSAYRSITQQSQLCSKYKITFYSLLIKVVFRARFAWFVRYQTVCVEGQLSKPASMECSIPQGSVPCPKNYVIYTKPPGDVIRTHELRHHFYADDTQLYLPFKPKDNLAQFEALMCIESCLKDMKSWMHRNMLKLNADKTEVMLFSPRDNSKSMD